MEEKPLLMWIFGGKDLSVKDIIEISSYELSIDEETNSNSVINVLKKTTAVSTDIIAVQKNGKTIYWGIIDQILNDSGKMKYQFYVKYITNLFDRLIPLGFEDVIRDTGIEDFLENEIKTNFTESDDEFINFSYLRIVVKSHSKKQTSVTNVDNGIYNFHTWLTNCTQNYNIAYEFEIIEEGNEYYLQMTIENKEKETVLIDCEAQGIIEYEELFDTEITSKVTVLSPTSVYTLYLLNDRTTTTDKTDVNRANGKITTVYVEAEEDMEQEALNVFKSNSYNHNISFKLYDRSYTVGTPIIIKTKSGNVYNTYISSVLYTNSKFIAYQCGNIRISLVDKLLKERG